MNLNDRLEFILGPHSPLSATARTRVKQLISDVLDEVKPAEQTADSVFEGYRYEAWKEVRHLEPSSPDYQNVAAHVMEGYNQAAYDMDAKRRELGV